MAFIVLHNNIWIKSNQLCLVVYYKLFHLVLTPQSSDKQQDDNKCVKSAQNTKFYTKSKIQVLSNRVIMIIIVGLGDDDKDLHNQY